MIWAWLLVVVIGVLIDLLNSSFLFVGFSIGALAALIINVFKLPILLQFVAFAVVSSLFFILIFPKVRKNIKKRREKLGLTQAELAEKTNLSHDFIRQIESSKVAKNFSVQTIYQISIALEVTMNDLFYENGIPPKF